jgi:Domain of unknown function (DUF4288)
MSHTPGTARWYLAEIVEEIKIADHQRNSVFNNLVLIEAGSADEAYDKALAHGKEREDNYVNSEGQQVTVVFRGLSDLNVIGDELEDGTEIIYEELTDLSESEISDMIPAKDALGVFQPEED